MKRTRTFGMTTLCILGAMAIGQVRAANVDVSLNLELNTLGDLNSGGTWTVVAKADERGVAGITLDFLSETLNFDSNTGFLTPVGFEVEESTIFGGTRLEIVQGDDLSDPTLDVGVIGGTFPSSYVDDPALQVLGAEPDLGSFTGGVELATGTFDAGDIPAWFGTGTQRADANVFVLTPTPTAIAATVRTTVRYTVPEPLGIALAGCGAACLLVIRHGRRAFGVR